MNEPFLHTVENLYAPKRIDAYLAAFFIGKYSREEIKRALKKGSIAVNGKTAAPRFLVSVGDTVQGSVETERRNVLVAEKTPLSIVYEDENLLVVDKAAGMVVHPGAGNKKGTLVHALLGRGSALSSMGDAMRPGIVHRLDKDTSGLLVVAKTNAAHRALQAQFASRTLSRTYLALVHGRVEFEEGHIDEPIGHHPKIRLRMAVSRSPKAREARTTYRVLRRFRRSTLIEVHLETGRTHQIRVHMEHLGHPVLNDAVYGTAVHGTTRQALHAAKIEFEHPETGIIMKFESPLPDDFKKMIEAEEAFQ